MEYLEGHIFCFVIIFLRRETRVYSIFPFDLRLWYFNNLLTFCQKGKNIADSVF